MRKYTGATMSSGAAAPAWSGLPSAPGDPGTLAAVNTVCRVRPPANMPINIVPQQDNIRLTHNELAERNVALNHAQNISPKELKDIIDFLKRDIKAGHAQIAALSAQLALLTPHLTPAELARRNVVMKHAESIPPKELQDIINYLKKDVNDRKVQTVVMSARIAPHLAHADLVRDQSAVSEEIAAELKKMSKSQIECSLKSYVKQLFLKFGADKIEIIIKWIKNDTKAMEWLNHHIQNNKLDKGFVLKRALSYNSLFAHKSQETVYTSTPNPTGLDDNEEEEDEYTYLDHATNGAFDKFTMQINFAR